eukprot:109245-Pelagomonas_calceolata.AAC.1
MRDPAELLSTMHTLSALKPSASPQSQHRGAQNAGVHGQQQGLQDQQQLHLGWQQQQQQQQQQWDKEGQQNEHDESLQTAMRDLSLVLAGEKVGFQLSMPPAGLDAQPSRTKSTVMNETTLQRICVHKLSFSEAHRQLPQMPL